MKKVSWRSLSWLCALAGLLGLSLSGCQSGAGRLSTRGGDVSASGSADDAKPCRFG